MARLTSYSRDGLVFDVRDEGPTTGEPVVLLHGFPQRSSCWDPVAALLHAEGFRTLAPDQRGYSPGARPRRRRDYRTSELRDDVVALLQLLDRPVHLVGHDWGAVVGWLVATDHPALLRSWTAVSVGHPAAFFRSFAASDQALRSWYMGLFQLPALPERLLSAPRGERMLGMDTAMLARYREEIVADGALRGGLSWYRALPMSDPRPAFSPVRVPTTMVWSDRDPALGRAGAEASSRWVEAPHEFVELPGVDHWVPEHAPDDLAAAILTRARG